jgi:hypothetical protein
VMLLLCFAQYFGYLFCIVFSSLGILQHYANFNTCTIVILKKLLGARSFGGSINHLACCQATLPASPNRFNLPSIVQTTTSTFLGCWALIGLTLVIHF